MRWTIEKDEPLQINDNKGEHEPVCVLYSEDAKKVMELLNKKEQRIEELEHTIHSLHGLYASDKEDMSESFRLDFSKLF